MQNQPQVLVVEDDDRLAQLLIEYLSQHGFALSRVASGDAGASAILQSQPDLVVLDLMLPGMNGLDVCRQVRAAYEGAILMLTASQSEADHVAGLELGADDFVVKPIEPRVLLARIRTLLRRRESARPSPIDGVLQVGLLVVDVGSREARVGEAVVPLTNMEFDVLAMLARDAGSVVHRDELYTAIMGVTYDGIDRGMDVHVSRIRRKLEQMGLDSTKLKSVRGAGYLLAAR